MGSERREGLEDHVKNFGKNRTNFFFVYCQMLYEYEKT